MLQEGRESLVYPHSKSHYKCLEIKPKPVICKCRYKTAARAEPVRHFRGDV